MNKRAIVVTGPTASGKTSLAVRLAAEFDGEIINVDSRQVYCGLDIGSGKDIEEYDITSGHIRCHMLDVADPKEVFTLKDFCEGASLACGDILRRGKLPVLCGGTPLYLSALLFGYRLPGGGPDKDLRKRLEKLPLDQLQHMAENESPELFAGLKDRNNRTRLLRCLEKAAAPERESEPALPPDMKYLVLAPYYPRSEIHRRIELRLDQRLEQGMVEEAKHLHQQGVSYERLEYFGLEYRYLALYLQNKLSFKEMREQLFIKIRQFAKRQDIWFRKLEREGLDIYHLKDGDLQQARQLVRTFLDNKKLPEPEFRLREHFYGPKQ